MILIYVENSIKRIDKKYWEFRDNYILDFSNYNNSTSHIEIHHLDNISVDAIDKLFKIVNLDNLFYNIIKADLYNSEKEIIDGIMSGTLLANTVINIIDTNQLTTSADIIKGNMISAQKRFYKTYKSNRIISETIYNNLFRHLLLKFISSKFITCLFIINCLLLSKSSIFSLLLLIGLGIKSIEDK